MWFRFKDRVTAAGILAESLKDKINTEERKNAIVLGIPSSIDLQLPIIS